MFAVVFYAVSSLKWVLNLIEGGTYGWAENPSGGREVQCSFDGMFLTEKYSFFGNQWGEKKSILGTNLGILKMTDPRISIFLC